MSTTTTTSTGSQTVHRAFEVLETVAAAGRSLALTEISRGAGLSGPTAHRLCRTLLDRGYMRQLPDRTYALGFRLITLGNAVDYLSAADAEGVLSELVTEIGETANLAVLAGHQAEYVAQVPARYAMRMFTEVGRRVDLHSTGVGKALLAELDDATAMRLVRRAGLAAKTPHTITTEVALTAALDEIRARGYAADEQEQELGVCCVAVTVAPRSLPSLALSVSGPLIRMTDDVLERAVPLLQAGARQLAARVDHGENSDERGN